MIEDAIGAAVAAQVGPLAAEVRLLAREVAELRRALPAPLGSIEQAAQLTGVSERTLRRKIKSREIPSRKIGRRVLIDLAALRPMTEDEVVAAARAARGAR